MLGPATFPRLAKRRPAAAHTLLALLSLAALVAGVGPLTAQTLPASTLPTALRGVGLDQKLGDQVPPDLVFRDEQGDPVSLGRYFGDRPVILALVYYECPMLCSLQLGGLVRSLRALTLNPAEDFEVVTISFDPGETPAVAAGKKAAYLERYARAGAESGWHFLTGAEESIEAITRAVGFRYAYDPETDEYSHAAGIVVLTPEGRISRYFYGIEYPARDLRLGLVEASGKSDRLVRRPGVAVLLPLRPSGGQVQPGHHERAEGGRISDGSDPGRVRDRRAAEGSAGKTENFVNRKQRAPSGPKAVGSVKNPGAVPSAVRGRTLGTRTQFLATFTSAAGSWRR